MEGLISEVKESLGTLISKPKMSDKLLSKPPFRFLHDIFTALTTVTTYPPTNLFTPSEQDSASFTDKPSKILYLQKIQTLTEILTQTKTNMKVAKVVAGLEAEETCKFLGLVSKAVEVCNGGAVDVDKAVQVVLDGGDSGTVEFSDLLANKNKKGRGDEAKGGPSSKSESKDNNDNDDLGGNLADNFPESKGTSSKQPSLDAEYALEQPAARAGTRGRGDKTNGERDRSKNDNKADALPPNNNNNNNQTSPNAPTSKGNSSKLDAQIEQCNTNTLQTREMIESLIAKPKCSDKLLSKPPFRFLHDLIVALIQTTGFGSDVYSSDEMDSANVKEKGQKIDFLEKIITRVGESLNTIVDARPAKIVAGLEAENTCGLLQLFVVAAKGFVDGELGGGGGSSAGESKGGDNDTSANTKSNTEDPGSPIEDVRFVAEAKGEERRDNNAASKGDTSNSNSNSPIATKNNAVRSPQQQQHANNNNNDNDTNSAEPKQAEGQKSMRPSTARRRPPKLKEANTAAVESKGLDSNNYGGGNGGGNGSKGIIKEGDNGDDAFFRDDDEEKESTLGDNNNSGAKNGSIDVNSFKGQNVSALVKNILEEETKNDNDAKSTGDATDANGSNSNRGIRLSLSLKNKNSTNSSNAGMSSSDMENLTNAVQRLCQSTAPLGKCMDYFSEDISLMDREGVKWDSEYLAKRELYTVAQRRTEDTLLPLKMVLLGLEDERKEWEVKVIGMKRKVKGNEGKILGLLRGVISN